MYELPDIQIKFRTSLSMAKIIKLMDDTGRVTGDAIENEHKIVSDAKVIMHKIRRRLAPFGITVHSRRDVGYWMDEPSREKLHSVLNSSAGQAGVSEVREATEDPHPDNTGHTH
jgi:hypothetical protein